jgi:hypothetical protein
MPTQPGTLELLLGEIGPILSPVGNRLSPDSILLTLAELGFQFPPELLNDTAFVAALTDASSAATAIPQLLEGLATTLEGDDVAVVIQQAVAIVDQFTTLFRAIDDVAAKLDAAAAALGMGSVDATEFARQLPRKLIELLAIERLESSRGVANMLQLLGIIERVVEPGVPGDPTRPEFERKALHLANLIDFVQSPAVYLENLYEWGSATFDAERLFTVLEDVVSRFGLPVTLVPATATDPLTLGIVLFDLQPDTSASPPGLTFSLDAPLEADFTADLPLGNDAWTMHVAATGQFDAGLTGSIRPPADVSVQPPSGTLDGELLATIVGQLPDTSARMVLLGVAGSSRVEVRRVDASLGLRFAFDGTRAIGETVAEVRIDDARAILDTSEGDGFLQDVLGGASGEAAFTLHAFWSPSTGLRFEGSSAIEVAIPVHASVGPIELTGLVIRSAPGDGAVPVEVSGNFRGQLGPLQFVVERIGLKIKATAPDEGGNLGPLNLDTAFKPPEGLGLTVDGGGFKGGGFLGFELEAARYSGMLELEFEDQFSVKAFGLLETRLPNGESGFSLVIVISAEFTPIQLGFGFTLNGVGGLLGLHRTVNVDRLVTGLRDQTLSNLLFPTDIVANADRILSDLRQVFPAARGRFIFGPMAKIAWGTPPLLTADVGLVLEVPEPVRLIILGVVRGILPDERAAILRLQVNFLGVIDFEQEHLSFDASLFDSSLLAFTLSGDMALRLYWGANANFLTTVGGFHPAYQPPPMNLPALRRLTLALLNGENPRLTLETYFAVTSNTVQFGARLELYAAAWKFNAYGFLSFDVLFQFNPFYFIADVTAMLALRVGSSSIASIKLTLTLEGPTPWKAKGDARLKLCWFLTVKVRFNKTFGEARTSTLPDLAVLPLVVAALDARDNWAEERQADRHRLESLRALPAGASEPVRVHPVGTVAISQKVVPLNIAIDRIGAQRPSDARTFAIAAVTVGDETQDTPPSAEESFAPAQFFDLSDAEKLASPSFKTFASGVRVGDADHGRTGYAAAREVRYELKYIDSQRDTAQPRPGGPRPGGLFDVDVVAFNAWTRQGATAKSDLSFARRRRSALAPEEVGVADESFAIVHSRDLTLFDAGSIASTERTALKQKDALIAANPALRGALDVVPLFELSA